MSPLPHEELKKLLGMDDALWEQAGYLQDFLQMLNQQRRSNPNALRGAYPVAALSMYRYSFHSTGGRWYDEKRKCLWYLGSKGPEEPEDPALEVRHIFHITQKGQYLRVYHDENGHRSRRFLKFDMLKPHHRQNFLYVRHIVEKHFPLRPAKHKDLLRVMRSPRGKKRDALKNILQKRGQKPSSQLRGEGG